MQRPVWSGLLWTGTFLCTVLAVAGAVFAFEASRWSERLDSVAGAPEAVAKILDDPAFKAGYVQWKKRGAAKPSQAPSVPAVRDWISAAAKGVLVDSDLRIKEIPPNQSKVSGMAEIRAEFKLPPVETRQLDQIIQRIELSHPELVCREFHLKPSDAPYRYEVSHMVVSIYVPAAQ